MTIASGASTGATIQVEALRKRMESAKQAYSGPDPAAFTKAIDDLLQSLTEKYGTAIPLDHAYELMKRLEAGAGLQ